MRTFWISTNTLAQTQAKKKTLNTTTHAEQQHTFRGTVTMKNLYYKNHRLRSFHTISRSGVGSRTKAFGTRNYPNEDTQNYL